MSEEKIMILDMVAAGKISVAEAERLIQALRGSTSVKAGRAVLPNWSDYVGWGPWMDQANELIFRNQLPCR